MSHDFVEAALLRRAGWEVWMAPDIGGSFEEPPPTLMDYLIRDRRWCQGNLQHLRVIFAQGLTLPSRMHMAMGMMSYLSSPLWLVLLIVSGTEMMSYRPPPAASLSGSSHPSLCLSCRRTGDIGGRHTGAAVRAQTAGGRHGSGRRSPHPCPWRHRALMAGRDLGSLVLDPDGPDHDAAAQLVCVLYPDGHVYRMEFADPHRSRPAAGAGGKEIRAPHHHRRNRSLLALAICARQFRLVCAAPGRLVPLCSTGLLSSSPLLGQVAREDHLFLVPSESRGLQGTGSRPWPCRPPASAFRPGPETGAG